MRFDYQALQRDGRVVAGLIEASSERAAHRDLLKRGVRPTAIRPQALPRATPRRATRFRPRRDHASVLRQLHALIAGGVPIVEAITALADATDDPELVASYVELNASLRRGDPLPQAILQCFPAIPLHVHRIVEAIRNNSSAGSCRPVRRVRTSVRVVTRWSIWTGRALSGLVILFLVSDAGMKIAAVP